MKIIGSKMAAKLVEEKFGNGAFVMRQGKMFIVGDLFMGFKRARGKGKSWVAALNDAGIHPLMEAPIKLPDTMPEDTVDISEVEMAEEIDPIATLDEMDAIVVEKLGSPDEEE